ncbi:MAG: polymer-forming cytoskeletal protein [Rickettsiales bacterium]|jgi:cytoskeletal protein CcmA (bactofilin family)|nr:polymer-forming cytoskeletal protein [Rickettsiales bacterium]
MADNKLINEIFNKKATPVQPPVFNYSKTHTVVNKNDGKQLVIGKNIKITGDIDVCDSLVIEGQLEANIKDARALDIIQGGKFTGEAIVEDAHISGLFDGTLNVSGTLYVYSTGMIKGKINYNNLVVEKGGVINGMVKTTKIKGTPTGNIKSKEEMENEIM